MNPVNFYNQHRTFQPEYSLHDDDLEATAAAGGAPGVDQQDFALHSSSSVDEMTIFQDRTILAPSDPICTVNLQKGVPKETLWKTVAESNSPKVIFWYIGSNGFKAEGARYYKEHFQQIKLHNKEAECILYDLTAWGGLNKKTIVTIKSENPNVQRINSFAIEGIRAIASNGFFSWLQNQDQPERTQYLKEVVLNRKFVYEHSAQFRPNGTLIESVFGDRCPILSKLAKKDCSHTYSALQYLEGLYLSEKFISESIDSKDIYLVFALPDDEWKYYFEKNQAPFHEDVSNMLLLKHGVALYGKKIHIEFCTFAFGPKRPYNTGKEEIKQIDSSLLV